MKTMGDLSEGKGSTAFEILIRIFELMTIKIAAETSNSAVAE